MFNFSRNCHKLLSKVTAPSTFPSATYKSSSSSTFSPTLGLVSLFTFSHYNECAAVQHCVWICISQMTNDVFMYLIAIHVSSFVKYLLKLFVHYLKVMFISFHYWDLRVLYLFWIEVSYKIHALQIFLPDCALSFHSIHCVFQRGEVFNFDEAHLPTFFFY